MSECDDEDYVEMARECVSCFGEYNGFCKDYNNRSYCLECRRYWFFAKNTCHIMREEGTQLGSLFNFCGTK